MELSCWDCGMCLSKPKDLGLVTTMQALSSCMVVTATSSAIVNAQRGYVGQRYVHFSLSILSFYLPSCCGGPSPHIVQGHSRALLTCTIQHPIMFVCKHAVTQQFRGEPDTPWTGLQSVVSFIQQLPPTRISNSILSWHATRTFAPGSNTWPITIPEGYVILNSILHSTAGSTSIGTVSQRHGWIIG